MGENLTIGFIGNPNCGKTTLFNAYTGANLKVANWPGVTVEKVEGAIKDHDMNIRLVDLPGTYSLTSYTMEEQVSRQFILSDEVDVIIDVADASALERNLYLTLQLLELGKGDCYEDKSDRLSYTKTRILLCCLEYAIRHKRKTNSQNIKYRFIHCAKHDKGQRSYARNDSGSQRRRRSAWRDGTEGRAEHRAGE